MSVNALSIEQKSLPVAQLMKTPIKTCGSRAPLSTNLQLKWFDSWISFPDGVRCFSLSITHVRSLSVRNLAFSGVSVIQKNAAIPTSAVIRPSRMKLEMSEEYDLSCVYTYIHCQPSSPEIPSMKLIPYANKPENAPAALAALKNRPCLSCVSKVVDLKDETYLKARSSRR